MNNAGAKLRAGLTEVPVNGIPMMCTNAKVKPITIPATVAFSVFLVTPRTVNTNTKVKIILPPQEEQIKYSKAINSILDNEKLKTIGWNAQYKLKDGLSITLDIIKELI